MQIKIIKDLILVWSIFNSNLKLYFVLLCVCSTISMMLEIISIGILIPFIALVFNPEALNDFEPLIAASNYVNIDLANIHAYGMTSLFVLTVLFATLGRIFTLLIKEDLNSRISIYLKSISLKNIFSVPYEAALDRDSSILITVITVKIDMIVRSIVNPIITTISSGIFLVGLFVSAFYLMPYLMIIFGVTLGPFLFIASKAKKRFLNRNGLTITKGQNAVTQDLRDTFNGLRDFFLSPLAFEFKHVEFTNHVKQLDTARRNNFVLVSAPRILVEAFILILFSVTVVLFASTEIAIPILAAFVLAVQKMLPHIMNIYYGSASLQANYPVLLDALPLLKKFPKDMTNEEALSRIVFEEKLELKDVGFSFAADTKEISEGFSLEILKGEKIAVIGSTGSGKSTLIEAIMGLRKPHRGTISIDGSPLATNSEFKQWQSLIAQVPQKPILFSRDVYGNIAFGVNEKEVDKQLINECSKIALIHERIMNLEKGYNTSLREDRKNLSGGEIQRIAIARALYLKKPVLIMDEATSALDPITSRELIKNIIENDPNQSFIMVTHELDLLDLFDKVLMVSDVHNIKEIPKHSVRKNLKSEW